MRRLLSLGCLFVAALTGCSGDGLPDMVPIRGSVSYNGKPLDHGTVIFVPVKARRQASGEIQRDGTYELTTLQKGDGAQFGDYKIVVHSLEAHPGEPTRMDYEESAQRGIERKQLIPERYASPETTPLTVTVDENHPGREDIELSD